MAERNFTPYQLVHLIKLLSNGQKSLLISDGVGVGKTISAGYIIQFVNIIMQKPVIILCPPVLEQKWIMDIKLRFDLEILSAKMEEDFQVMVNEIRSQPVNPKIYIIPYSSATRRKLPVDLEVGLVVMDEIHHARNRTTNLYKILGDYCGCSEFRIGLSATPIQNTINDLSSIMSLLFPVFDYTIWKLFIDEIWRRKQLSILSPFVTKFTKDRLGLAFTKRQVHQLNVEYDASYVQLVQQSLDKIGQSKGKLLTSFEKIIYLRMASSSPNAFFKSIERGISEDYPNQKINKLENLISANGPGRWIIFTEFKETAKLIINSFPNRPITLISGESSFSERYLAFDNFRANSDSILVMMPVGSEGLDLQICSRMVNFDLHWNPMKLEQRIGRIDRIGQNKESVDIFNFVVRGSVDEQMLSILKSKLDIVEETFASTEDVLSNNSRPLSTGSYFSNIDEKSSIESFLKKMSFYENIQSDDYELASLLPVDTCDCLKWDTFSDNWLNEVILRSDNCKELANNFYKSSEIPLSILREYGS